MYDISSNYLSSLNCKNRSWCSFDNVCAMSYINNFVKPWSDSISSDMKVYSEHLATSTKGLYFSKEQTNRRLHEFFY